MKLVDSFENKKVNNKLNHMLGIIENIDLGYGLDELKIKNKDLYKVASISDDTLVLRILKKTNMSNVINTIISDLVNVLDVDDSIIKLAYRINSYNENIYISKKY